ncbi:MAG: mandelate racemase/muconate lactonizing enzyme family protein [Acidobacteria bacterium]|nr:mandelate racemase/muconate lactonizing enzyme family protein [Acidobacteriota bacterium]
MPLANTAPLRRARLHGLLAAQAASTAGQPYAITTVEAWNLKLPKGTRAWSLVRLRTREGLEGWGEARPLTSEALRSLRQAVINASAAAYEPLRLKLRGHAGLAAVNAASLDILAQASKAPVYQYLGGPTRFKVRAYTSLHGANDEELARLLELARGAGFRAFAFPVPRPPFRNSGKAFVLATQKRFETLKKAAGEGCDFILNGSGTLTPGDAQLLAAAFERSHVMWFDEPCAVTSLGPLRKMADESVTPLGFGMGAADAAFFQNLLREDAVDLCRPELAVHGISGCRRIAALAETYYVAVAPRSNEGPVSTAAAIHLAASLPNFVVQHVPFHEVPEDRAMRAELTEGAVEVPKDGFLPLLTKPGLGITVNRAALRKYGEVVA